MLIVSANCQITSCSKAELAAICKTCLSAVEVLLQPPLLQVCILMRTCVWDSRRSDLAVDTLFPRGGGVSAVRAACWGTLAAPRVHGTQPQPAQD